MALDYPVAYEDRAELEQYTYANAALLTHPDIGLKQMNMSTARIIFIGR